MKLLIISCLLLALTKADECPEKFLKSATKNIKSYFKSYYKKVGNIKINCNYEHNSNIFNLEHHIKAEAALDKRKLNFEVKTHSSLFNVYDFSDFDGKICHSNMKEAKGSKDINLIKKSFLKKFAKDISDKDIQKNEKNGEICYTAKVTKKMKRSLIDRKSVV